MPLPLVIIADPHGGTRELLADIFRFELDAYVMLLSGASELGSALHETIPALAVVEIGRDRVADAQAVREIKRLHPSVPFLVLTAHGLDDAAVERQTGADAVIGKPFELEAVIATAERLMRGVRMREDDDVPEAVERS